MASEVDWLENITSQQLQDELDQIVANYKEKKNKKNAAKIADEKFIISVWNFKQNWALATYLNKSEKFFIYGERSFRTFYILINTTHGLGMNNDGGLAPCV